MLVYLFQNFLHNFARIFKSTHGNFSSIQPISEDLECGMKFFNVFQMIEQFSLKYTIIIVSSSPLHWVFHVNL